MPLIKTATLALKVLLIIWLLQGCGRKGPLFMQADPAKSAPAIAAPAEKKAIDTALPVQSQPSQTQTESQKKP